MQDYFNFFFLKKKKKIILARPVRREDEAAIVEMMAMASPEDVRFPCFGAIKDFPHIMAERTREDRSRARNDSSKG